MIIKFDVFGKKMSVIKKGNDWQLFYEPDIGLRSRVYDVIIPPDVTEDEQGKYLDDIYHKYASVKHPTVKRLN